MLTLRIGAPALSAAQEGSARGRGRPKKMAAATTPVRRAVPEVVVVTPARNARAAPRVDGEGVAAWGARRC